MMSTAFPSLSLNKILVKYRVVVYNKNKMKIIQSHLKYKFQTESHFPITLKTNSRAK
jgi:hypothetical protein